jgi:peptide/nickel transport system ATP-binding protein
MAEPALAIEGLEVALETRGRRAVIVDGVSLVVAAGETVALVGESGAGKTVLALAVMGLLPADMRVTRGSIRVTGDELVGARAATLRAKRGRDMAMIFQDPQASLHPAFRIGAQIAEAIWAHDRSVSKRAAAARAVELLGLVGIPDPATRVAHYPHQLSGGLRQRAMIAMAIANRPRLLIADEATTALDVTVQAQVLEVLCAAQQQTGAGMLLVTHDLGVVAGIAHRVVVMYAGRLVETGLVDDVLGAPIHPYTRGLLAAVPRLAAHEPKALVAIPGQPPGPFDRPSGCAFHPRCAYADARCQVEVPLLASVGGEATGSSSHAAACHHADRLVMRGP